MRSAAGHCCIGELERLESAATGLAAGTWGHMSSHKRLLKSHEMQRTSITGVVRASSVSREPKTTLLPRQSHIPRNLMSVQVCQPRSLCAAEHGVHSACSAELASPSAPANQYHDSTLMTWQSGEVSLLALMSCLLSAKPSPRLTHVPACLTGFSKSSAFTSHHMQVAGMNLQEAAAPQLHSSYSSYSCTGAATAKEQHCTEQLGTAGTAEQLPVNQQPSLPQRATRACSMLELVSPCSQPPVFCP